MLNAYYLIYLIIIYNFFYQVKCSETCLRNFNKPNHKPYYNLLSFCLIFVFHVYSYFVINICRCDCCMCACVCEYDFYSFFFRVIFRDLHHSIDACLMLGLPCRCHLSNIMPDSIFYDFFVFGICLSFLFVFLQGVVTTFFPQIRSDGCFVLPL